MKGTELKKSTEISKEIRETINALMKKIVKESVQELSDYKKEIGNLCLSQANLNAKLANDLIAIQNSIHAHAVGVQNVYNEMQELKKLIESK